MLLSIFPTKDGRAFIENGMLKISYVDGGNGKPFPLEVCIAPRPPFEVSLLGPTGNAHEINIYSDGKIVCSISVFRSVDGELADRLAKEIYENLRLLSAGIEAEDVMKLFNALKEPEKKRFLKMLGVGE